MLSNLEVHYPAVLICLLSLPILGLNCMLSCCLLDIHPLGQKLTCWRYKLLSRHSITHVCDITTLWMKAPSQKIIIKQRDKTNTTIWPNKHAGSSKNRNSNSWKQQQADNNLDNYPSQGGNGSHGQRTITHYLLRPVDKMQSNNVDDWVTISLQIRKTPTRFFLSLGTPTDLVFRLPELQNITKTVRSGTQKESRKSQ